MKTFDPHSSSKYYDEPTSQETHHTYTHPTKGKIEVHHTHESMFSNPKKQWFHGNRGGNGTTAKKLDEYLSSLKESVNDKISPVVQDYYNHLERARTGVGTSRDSYAVQKHLKNAFDTLDIMNAAGKRAAEKYLSPEHKAYIQKAKDAGIWYSAQDYGKPVCDKCGSSYTGTRCGCLKKLREVTDTHHSLLLDHGFVDNGDGTYTHPNGHKARLKPYMEIQGRHFTQPIPAHPIPKVFNKQLDRLEPKKQKLAFTKGWGNVSAMPDSDGKFKRMK